MLYVLKDEAMADLQSWLANAEAMWTMQLSSHKAHAAKARK